MARFTHISNIKSMTKKGQLLCNFIGAFYEPSFEIL